MMGRPAAATTTAVRLFLSASLVLALVLLQASDFAAHAAPLNKALWNSLLALPGSPASLQSLTPAQEAYVRSVFEDVHRGRLNAASFRWELPSSDAPSTVKAQSQDGPFFDDAGAVVLRDDPCNSDNRYSFVGEDEDCSSDNVLCKYGLACVGDVCVPRRMPGEACDPADEAVPPCMTTLTCVDEVCEVANRQAGDACVVDEHCASLDCSDGICADSCVFIAGIFLADTCSRNEACTREGNSECEPVIEEGEACADSNLRRCAFGTSCVKESNDADSGICRAHYSLDYDDHCEDSAALQCGPFASSCASAGRSCPADAVCDDNRCRQQPTDVPDSCDTDTNLPPEYACACVDGEGNPERVVNLCATELRAIAARQRSTGCRNPEAHFSVDDTCAAEMSAVFNRYMCCRFRLRGSSQYAQARLHRDYAVCLFPVVAVAVGLVVVLAAVGAAGGVVVVRRR